MRTVLFVGVAVLFLGLVAAVAFVPRLIPASVSDSPEVSGANAKATLDAASAFVRASESAREAAEVRQAEMIARATLDASESGATATAGIKATESGLGLRSTGIAISAIETKTASDISATATVRAFEFERVALEIERARMSNGVRAFGGYFVMAAISFGLLYGLISYFRYRRVPKGDSIIRGDRLINPAMSPAAVVDLKTASGVVPIDVAERIKARDQAVDAVRASGRTITGSDVLPLVNPSPVEIVDAESVSVWIDDAEESLLLNEGSLL